MLPDEIYASSASSSKFKYSHPLNHMMVDDGSLRARLAYDLMTFMQREDCSYYITQEGGQDYSPLDSDDEVDIMIVDGFYKEADILLGKRLSIDPENEKFQFQKAFLDHLKNEYARIVKQEDQVLASDPNNVNALINKGFALANINREKEALDLADKVLNIDPDNLTALGNKAYIAKLLNRDDLHEIALKQAYNVCAKLRREQLAKDESRLLRDMNSEFMKVDTPSAFLEFNRRSGHTSSSSKSVH